VSGILDLVRAEIRDLRPYRAAQFADGLLRLNANETPWRPPLDGTAGGLNRYPETRPVTLTESLAEYYALSPAEVLVTRGSSEAIDLLVRCFCRAGQDDIVICPPTFGMYEVYAQVQGAGTIRVPLLAADGFALDTDGIKAAWTDRCKLLFLCSPNNPTGNAMDPDQIDDLCRFLDGRGLVVVDAAYVEFADEDPTTDLLQRHDNIVVLRTLSKALGLAGIRCGAALASAEIVDLLGRILPPYAYPTPSQDAALACLDPAYRDELVEHTATLRSERGRMVERFQSLPGVTRIWPSEANFLLVETRDPAGMVEAARNGGVLIRDFSADPLTRNCLRITVGEPAENDQLLSALGATKG
jgi:histidinol-phosphate aminotransferase